MIENLKNKLATGVASFTYETTKGEERKVVGTTCPSILTPLLLGQKVVEFLEEPDPVGYTPMEKAGRHKEFVEKLAFQYAKSNEAKEKKPEGPNITYYDLGARSFKVFKINLLKSVD